MIAETADRNMDLWDGQSCTCATGYRYRCLRAATVTVTWACVHEHLHRAHLCAACMQKVAGSGGIACHRCQDSARPHLCIMTEVKREPLDHAQRASQQNVRAPAGGSGPGADR